MPARSDLAIRPLALGEVIDRAVALTVRHFRALFVAMLVVEAPALALARAQSAGLADVLALVQAPAGPDAAAGLRRVAASSAAMLVVLLALQLAATAACAAIVAPSLDAGPAGPPAARRVRSAAVAAAATVALLLAAPVAGAAPGAALAAWGGSLAARIGGLALAAAGSLALFLGVLLRSLLAPVAAAVEGRGGLRAVARSARLMAARPGVPFLERPGVRASILLLATFVLALAVNGLAGLPRALAARAAGGGALALLPGRLPLAAEIAVSVLEAAASAALQPFSLVAVTVFYFDRRARTEGLDLERWAEGLR